MSELPVGTVTFVFTDIEGSTRLLKRLGSDYSGLLSRHRELVRRALEQNRGREMDTQGEGFFLAFGRAKDAVAAAVAIQRSHDGEAWPEGADVRVRIGMHTSEPELSNDRYIGLGVHRAARICAVGHGGQVLASRSTAGLVDEEESPGIEFRDLGEHQLKDLDRNERIYQLVAAGLAVEFPPLRSLTEIGRSAEAALPSGTVTFLVTDIVGSTKLIREAGGETAGLVLEEYERILRDATEQAEGHVLEMAGDSLIAAFVRGSDALITAASAMAAFATTDWPEAQTPRGQDRPPHRRGVSDEGALYRAHPSPGVPRVQQRFGWAGPVVRVDRKRARLIASRTRSRFATSARINWMTSTGPFDCTSWLSEHRHGAPCSWRGRPSSGSVSQGATERT